MGADRSEVFVERVGDEVLEGAGPPVGDLVCDLLGWTLEAERGDLEEVGDFASALGVVADVPLRVGLGASDRVGGFHLLRRRAGSRCRGSCPFAS